MKKKLLILFSTLVILVTSSVIMAVAAGGITFSEQAPTVDSISASSKPEIKVTASTSTGTIEASDVQLLLDSQEVPPNVAPGNMENTYNISYIPTEALNNGLHTVTVNVYDDITSSTETTNWSFNVDSAPQFSNITPANNATLEGNKIRFSAYVKDTFDNLNSSSARLTLNGTTVTPKLTYKGHYVYDSCGYSSYVIDSYKEGTLSYEFSYLKEGSYNAELTITDAKGNRATEQWEFTIKSPPKFSGFTPTNGTLINDGSAVSSISVKVDDDSGIDPTGIQLYVNDVQVTHSFDTTTNIITYNDSFNDGNYNIKVTAKDVNGNIATANWSFTVSADILPKVISLTPADGGTVTTASPKITASVKDTYDNLNSQSVSLIIDGTPVSASFAYKGHTTYDSCGYSYYVIDSYKEGIISYQTSNLNEGSHTVELSIADAKGNVLTENWSFNVGTPPVFSNLYPSNNSTIGQALKISASINDANGVDWDTVILRLDSNIVPHKLDPAANLVYYDGFIADGIHTVTLTAKDLLGNEGSTTWNFNKDSAPPIASQWSPAKDSKVDIANPSVSVYITDIVDELDPQSVTAKINGKTVSPSFQFKGHWETYYDTCTGTVKRYIIESKKEGTISFSTAGLTDGVYPVEVSIADVRGNVLKESWSFTVGVPPKFSNLYPANDSENSQVNRVSAVIKDDLVVDWNSIILKVNGNIVSHQLDTTTNTVYYEGSFPTGTYDISIDVKDNAGNLSSTNWSFITDLAPPTMGPLVYSWGTHPSSRDSFVNGLSLTNKNFTGNLNFYASIKDLVAIRREVVSTLEGIETKTGTVINKPLDIDIRFRGYTDSCTGIYIEKYDNEGSFNHSIPIKDGEYKLSLNFADVLGNDITHTLSFTVQSAPVIKDMAPIKYGLQDSKPTISANVSDQNGNIIPESIQLKFNGSIVAHNYDTATGQVTYTPPEPLANESYHTATLTATDDQGLTTTETWKFYINTYPDMPDSSPANCTTCHENTSSNPLYGTYHSGARFSGDHGDIDRCNYCHTYITYSADCLQCHGFEDGTEIAPHGSTPTISYQAVNYDPNFPVRVIQNREMNDCVICHQPGMNVYKTEWARVQPTILMVPHDIPELHKTSASSCNNCHALSLTREHTRDGRTDQSGNTITCNTCHLSTSTEVKAAITNKDTSCTACHTETNHSTVHISSLSEDCQACHDKEIASEHARDGRTDAEGNPLDCNTCHNNSNPNVVEAIQLGNKSCSACHESADHESVHQSSLDSNCQTCHNNGLTTEHLDNTTTANKNYDCDTCHSNTTPSIRRTITANKLNCSGCHTEGHNLVFADTVPADIPLYPGFQWTTPMEASLFIGEPSTPDGYDAGQVIISNRLTDVTATEAWNFYNEQLALSGWSLISEALSNPEVSFTAEFEKAGRYVTVSYGDNPSETAGNRIEIWYK